MTTNTLPILAFHGHAGGRAVLLLLVVAVCALIIACWPSKTETK